MGKNYERQRKSISPSVLSGSEEEVSDDLLDLDGLHLDLVVLGAVGDGRLEVRIVSDGGRLPAPAQVLGHALSEFARLIVSAAAAQDNF